MPRIVLLSDTHNAHDEIQIPAGDILIHAGDATNQGTIEEIAQFSGWFKKLPHKYKIFVAGNHDWLFETNPQSARKLVEGIIYLQDSFVEIENLKIYGSPWQPRFFDWAFNLRRGTELAEKWRLIPNDTNVLITHGPPYGILDEAPRGSLPNENVGCEDLRGRIEELVSFDRLKLHIFGHIHFCYGVTEKFGEMFNRKEGVKFVNASNCDESYAPINPPIVFDL
jgi:Icc-related predicted phosphoesterase